MNWILTCLRLTCCELNLEMLYYSLVVRVANLVDLFNKTVDMLPVYLTHYTYYHQ